MARGGEREIDGMLTHQGVWRRRQPQVKAALKRYAPGELKSLLSLAAEVDEVLKGVRRGRPWDALTTLVIAAIGPDHAPYAHPS
jgi:DNA polymerase III delta subunit